MMTRTNSLRRKRVKLAAAAMVIAAAVLSLFAGSPGEAKDEGFLVWPDPPEPARIKFVASIASAKDLRLKQSSFIGRLVKRVLGTGDTETPLLQPYGITSDSRGRLIVADAKARVIHVFDQREKKYFVIKPPKNERLVSPIGVATDADDNVYVSDSFTGKILVFEKSGDFKKRLGGSEGMFNRPTGIAIDKASRRLYVVETIKAEISVLSLDGVELMKFGRRGEADGEFNYPTQVCVRCDRIYVTDTLNARVQIFDAAGRFISKIGRHGDAVGDLDKPKGVAVDSEGHIYVVEGLNDRVQIYDPDGSLLLAFGESGSRRGEFSLPTAIHIDGDDTIFVSDSSNRRVQVFKYLKNGGQ